jgi:hypothetical protein
MELWVGKLVDGMAAGGGGRLEEYMAMHVMT